MWFVHRDPPDKNKHVSDQTRPDQTGGELKILCIMETSTLTIRVKKHMSYKTIQIQICREIWVIK